MAYRGEQAGLRRITGKAFPRALPVPPVLPSKCVFRFSRCCAWQLQSKFHPQIAHVSSCDRTVSAAGQIQSFPFRQAAPFHEAAGIIFWKPFLPIFSQSDIAHPHQLLILQIICSMHHVYRPYQDDIIDKTSLPAAVTAAARCCCLNVHESRHW
jgi:hypothetical protein